MRQRKQIITSLMMGGALAALSATAVSAAQQPSQSAKATPNKDLVAQANQQPLVPNPKITIDGVSATPGVGLASPLMPRAVAPPVGDISVSNLDGAIFSAVDLGSDKNIPNLALKDAPVREVLELLVRNAGLNLVYMGSNPDDKNLTPSAPKAEPKITLNLQNEPVQSAFNFVLKMSGFEAIRVGRTVFVGSKFGSCSK